MALDPSGMQDPSLMDDIDELENSFISDVAKLLRENWADLTAEAKQDLIDFELGKLDFDSLYSKWWNEDGSWKDQLAGLEDMFKGFNLDARDTAVNSNVDSSRSMSSVGSSDGSAIATTEPPAHDGNNILDEDSDVPMDIDN